MRIEVILFKTFCVYDIGKGVDRIRVRHLELLLRSNNKKNLHFHLTSQSKAVSQND